MTLQREMFERKSDKVVLGLDLSLTSAGVVLLDADGAVWGAATVGYKLDEKASVKRRIQRLVDIWSAIDSLAFRRREDEGLGRPDMVGIEGYAHRAMGRGKDVAEVHGLVKVMLYSRYDLVPFVVAPSAVRKEVFGHGGTDKKDIKAALAVLESHGVLKGERLKDHNQRDAWAIAQYVRRRHG